MIPAERLLLWSEMPLFLPPKALDVLIVLVRNAGRLVTKEKLIRGVWPDVVIEEANLTQNISVLRKTLGRADDSQCFIETVPKSGYRFVAEVRNSGSAGLDAAGGLNDPAEIYFSTRTYVPPFGKNTRANPVSEFDWSSVAVLPFRSLTSEPADEYFVDGLTEELIQSLTQVSGLRVVARTSCFQFKNSARDVREIGSILRAGMLVEGSVRKSGGTLRVVVQLVSAANGCHVWSSSYDRPMDDALSIQRQLARDVSLALQPHLRGEAPIELADRTPRTEVAYHAYLKGRFFCNKRTAESLKISLGHFQSAIEADRTYATAYAGLADCLLWMGVYALPPHQMMPQARAAAQTALSLEPELAEAQASLAIVQGFYEWDWRLAERSLKTALHVSPNCVAIYPWYALTLCALGRHEEAVEMIARGDRLDPISPLMSSLVGLYLFTARRFDEAVKRLREAVALDPHFYRTHWCLGMCHEALGNSHDAIASFETAVEVSARNHSVIGTLAHCHGKFGDRIEAGKLLAELLGRSEKQYVSAPFLAIAHIGLGLLEDTFEWLQKGVQEHAAPLPAVLCWPVFDPIRSDPRFDNIRRQVRLA